MARPPAGPRIVRKLAGSDSAKERLEAILQTISGESTVEQAATQLDLRPARFYVIRDQALEAALERLDPRPTGRPPKPAPTSEALLLEALQQELATTKRELELARLRAETAQLAARPQKTPRNQARVRRRQRALRRR